MPYGALGLLVAWTLATVLLVPDPAAAARLGLLLFFALFFHGLGLRFDVASLRAWGLALLGATYFAAGVAFLGLDVVAGVGFVTLAIAYVVVRQIAERFAPLLARPLAPEARARILGALGRATLRLVVAATVADLLSVLTADLSGAGTVPATTIPTALFMAIGFFVVVVLIALLPLLERRAA